MEKFSYDRTSGTPEKKNQSALMKLSNVIDRRLMQKILNFVDKI